MFENTTPPKDLSKYAEEYNLNNNINKAKKEILNTFYDCILSINEHVKNLISQYNDDLLELLSVLAYNKEDTDFPSDDGKAIGKYLKSKGYSKEELKIIISSIEDYFD